DAIQTNMKFQWGLAFHLKTFKPISRKEGMSCGVIPIPHVRLQEALLQPEAMEGARFLKLSYMVGPSHAAALPFVLLATNLKNSVSTLSLFSLHENFLA